MSIIHVGIDLAKNVFAVHGVDQAGKPARVRPAVARAKLHELIASLPPCTVAMEVCAGAHHWARLFAAHGCQCQFNTPHLCQLKSPPPPTLEVEDDGATK